MKRVAGSALYLSLITASWLARAVPVRLAYGAGRLGGRAAYYLWPGGRRRSQNAMRRVAGGDRALAKRYARQSFEYYGTYLIDFLRFGSFTPEHVIEAVDFDDWPRIEEQRQGNGILFVTLHFGNWDLAGAAITTRGIPMVAVADTFAHAGINRLVVGARSRLGMRVLPAERTGPEVLRALQRNDVVALLADVPQGSAGVQVDFFGEPVFLPDGPARIALRTGAPIMVGGVWRRGPVGAHYDADVELVRFEASGERDADILGLTQAMVEALERLIHRAPEQWYIFRNLWPADAGLGVA
ncbi:MAG: hypothetical protein R3C39_08870 [Dehalococcoidia bacterium]